MRQALKLALLRSGVASSRSICIPPHATCMRSCMSFTQPACRPARRNGIGTCLRAYSTNASPTQRPTHRSAKAAVVLLIGINTAVFGTWQYAEITQDAKLLTWLPCNTTLSWENINAGRYHTIISSAFSHKDLPHFLFNAFTMWTFGSMLSFVPGVGAFHIATLALGGAVASSGAWLWHQEVRNGSPKSRGFQDLFTQHYPQVRHQALGSSGVVMAMAAVATCLMPLAPMSFMFIPIPIPLFVLTAAYAAVDTYYINSQKSRIGHSAHLGGFVFGITYYFASLRRRGGIWPLLRHGLRR